MYIRDNKFYTAALDTSKNGTNAYIKVKFYGGSGGNPFTNPQVSVSATNAGAFSYTHLDVYKRQVFIPKIWKDPIGIIRCGKTVPDRQHGGNHT